MHSTRLRGDKGEAPSKACREGKSHTTPHKTTPIPEHPRPHQNAKNAPEHHRTRKSAPEHPRTRQSTPRAHAQPGGGATAAGSRDGALVPVPPPADNERLVAADRPLPILPIQQGPAPIPIRADDGATVVNAELRAALVATTAQMAERNRFAMQEMRAQAAWSLQSEPDGCA